MNGEITINARIIFAVCFCALMGVMGASGLFAWVSNLMFAPTPQAAVHADVPIEKSFKKKYPFNETAGKNCSASRDLSKELKRCSAYVLSANRKILTIKQYMTNKNPLSGPFRRLTPPGKTPADPRIVETGIVTIIRLRNGYFTSIFSGRGYDRNSLKELRDFATWLRERKIPLLQLLTASKSDDRVNVFPAGIPRRYARMMEECETFLAENNIPYFDAKDILLRRNGDFNTWFYKTDHHWNVFAGRLIAEETARKLHDELKIAINSDVLKEENFTLVRYPAVFQGWLGNVDGAEPEDFDIFYQKEESRFHLQIPSIGIDRVGGFNDTLIAKSYLKSNCYLAFLYGDQPLVQIENQSCTNGTRILVIKQSMADIICPYLACAVQYLDMIDPRHFDGNIKAFIEQTKPDIVLVCI